jgi:DUF1016 N-terminal domain
MATPMLNVCVQNVNQHLYDGAILLIKADVLTLLFQWFTSAIASTEKFWERSEQVVGIISKIRTTEFERGFSRKSLFHMIRFAEIFPDEAVVSTLSRQLTWSA